ncbi:MAG: putative toxin-antitoxin system toxin component, PIN family [Thermomicrobiales bacterium]
MRRILFDANVWVSAFIYPSSVPGQSIRLLRLKRVSSVISPALIDQVLRALVRIRASEETLQEARTELVTLSSLVEPTLRLAVIIAKESDNRVLECAVAGQVEFIVTGDRKHLLRLGQYEGIPIISPREFVETVGS